MYTYHQPETSYYLDLLEYIMNISRNCERVNVSMFDLRCLEKSAPVMDEKARKGGNGNGMI